MKAAAASAPGADHGARPVTALRGVGAALAERLEQLGVTRVADLLFVLPLRYEDRTQVTQIGALNTGQRAAVEGEVLLTEVAYRGRRQLLCRISDGSGMLTLRFFYFSGAQQANLARGTRLRCFGEVRRGPLGLEMVHPEYRRLGHGSGAAGGDPHADLSAHRRSAAGAAARTDRRGAARARAQRLCRTGSRAEAGLPAGLPSLGSALTYLHRPPREAQLEELAAGRHPAQRRLAFEELLAHHLALKLRKRALKTDPAWALTDEAGLAQRFLAGLPFALTGAQRRALAGCRGATSSTGVPMVRLVQGDVGCGKTVVAAAAAARAAGSGLQAALMAPTELLAEQHWRNLRDWFHPLGRDRGPGVRAHSRRAPGAAHSRPSPPARCASSSAPTRCFRRASSSRASRSSSSTSSTASACSSA